MEGEFDNLVDEAINTIPQEFLEKLDNVEILVEDWPSPYQLHKMRGKGVHGMLLGLYEGVPQTRRRNYGGVLPDKITIFKIPIIRISRNAKELKEQVRDTVIHEIGHHFGMSEEEIHSAMKGK